MKKKELKVAILHEMLIKLGGAEKVVEKLLDIFPDADLFTLIYDESKVWNVFPKEKINTQCFSLTSQKIYNLTKKQRFCLAAMSWSVESLDFSKYDLVISSSSGFAHWAITKPETQFLVYYHSPARYMWDWTNEYKKDIWCNKWIKWFLLNKLFLNLRQWDVIASSRVDTVVANANNTANRITKYYRRDSELLYPPIEVSRFQKEISDYNNTYWDYYIIISALTEFKRLDVAISSFNKMLDKKLLIIWAWDSRNKLESLVEWNNIIFTGPQYWDDLVWLVQNSQGLIFPGEEDFGIVPIEVMATWKPVFALWKWGLLETVIQWETWDFFENDNWWDFIEKFIIFHENNLNWKYTIQNCKKQADKFSDIEFEKNLLKLIK
jgi:glycosyltransferase involved in cell wall biosynthesis